MTLFSPVAQGFLKLAILGQTRGRRSLLTHTENASFLQCLPLEISEYLADISRDAQATVFSTPGTHPCWVSLQNRMGMESIKFSSKNTTFPPSAGPTLTSTQPKQDLSPSFPLFHSLCLSTILAISSTVSSNSCYINLLFHWPVLIPALDHSDNLLFPLLFLSFPKYCWKNGILMLTVSTKNSCFSISPRSIVLPSNPLTHLGSVPLLFLSMKAICNFAYTPKWQLLCTS